MADMTSLLSNPLMLMMMMGGGRGMNKILPMMLLMGSGNQFTQYLSNPTALMMGMMPTSNIMKLAIGGPAALAASALLGSFAGGIGRRAANYRPRRRYTTNNYYGGRRSYYRRRRY